MYYQNYEDYMRSVLGYPIESKNTYESYQSMYDDSAKYSSEIMDLYPDIYKIINPMVCKICEVNTKPITHELLEQMTNEIYLNLETEPEMDNVINVRVTTPTFKQNQNAKKQNISEHKVENREENRENRQRKPNNTLRDLIKILILNRLLHGGPFHRPHHPPMSPRPLMEPFFTREDRKYNQYLKF